MDLTARREEADGYANDGDATMAALGRWSRSRKGSEGRGEWSGERAGEWDRGVGAWRPYPFPASGPARWSRATCPIATRSHKHERGEGPGMVGWPFGWPVGLRPSTGGGVPLLLLFFCFTF